MPCTLRCPLSEEEAPHRVAMKKSKVNGVVGACVMRAWLASEDSGATGEYIYYTEFKPPWEHKYLVFRFTDYNTAFHFKMVHG